MSRFAEGGYLAGMPFLRLFIVAALSCAAMGAEKPAKKAAATPGIPAAALADARKADALFAQGDLAGAQRAYEQALAKAPENAHLLTSLGVARFRDGRFAQAEVVLKQAVAIAPADDFSHATLGTVFFMQGRYDDALLELDTALKLNPKNAAAHCYKGICASTKGWQGLARQELETALQLDPKLADAHFNLAVLFATQQPPDKENARRHYTRARELGAEADPALEESLK
jgi:tetratricopeptide (TPR) repeat protein